MANIKIFSTATIAVARTDGNAPSQNPITASDWGDGFSWQAPSDVVLTFDKPNAEVAFDDDDGILVRDPVDSSQNVTDQLLTETTVIDGTTFSPGPDNVTWHHTSYVEARYTVTLFDASGTEYKMLGLSIMQDFQPHLVGVSFLNGTPPAGTQLFYRQGQSQFDPNPEVPLTTMCFGADCLISTDQGPVRAGDLCAGMLVQTRDAGLQPVLWAGQRHLDQAALALAPQLRPVRIRAGALGDGLPLRDLIVSPQHRILVRSAIALRMFGAPEVLVAAKTLLGLDGIEIAEDMADVTYVHFLLDGHQVVFAEGAQTESLYTGPEAIKTLGPAARAELAQVFPGLFAPGYRPVAARRLIPGAKARKLAQRHQQNARPLLA